MTAQVTLGDGTLHPDASGYLLVKNLPPGKYGIIVNPPVANPQWIQVTTIEGTKVIDAWVKANEPPFFAEFGVPMPHIVMGFIQPFNELPTPGDDPVATVQGTVRDTHFSRPPDGASFPGRLFPNCIVALTDAAGGPTLVAESCDANSHFSIENVPGGTYILTIWDANLDMIIAFQTVIVQQDGTCSGATGCDFGDIPVNNWFARLNTAIFSDTNQNGFWDSGEGPVGPEAGPVSIRWRDGTVYQGFPTDTEGLAPFDEIFPFFHWLVAEVGFSNKKATGATFVVDAGGEIANLNNTEFPDYGELVPQLQNVPACGVGTTTDCTYDGGNSRTETGPVLTQAFQAFAGLNNVLQFGKAEYMDYDRTGAPPGWTFVGENGGISGIVHYATTRAENDPRNAVGETWEPGIPRVQVALYANGDVNCPPLNVFPGDPCDIDWNGDGIQEPNSDLAGEFTDINNDGVYTLADVDNYPLGWADGGAKGNEDVDRNGNGTFDYGDALQVTWTDSWDDSPPTDCGGDNALFITGDEAADAVRCFDGFRNANQVRPGVFDGGYAFSDYDLSRLPDRRGATKLQWIRTGFYSTIRTRTPHRRHVGRNPARDLDAARGLHRRGSHAPRLQAGQGGAQERRLRRRLHPLAPGPRPGLRG